MAYILGSGGANLFHTPVQNGTDGAGNGTPRNSMGTPVPPGTKTMYVFLNKQSNEFKVGYFGKLEFLDNQEEFDKTVGLVPAQDIHFFYARSRFSALQNCVLIFSTNFQFIFTFK